ncbi:alpha/beta hydrolase family protein [Propionicimonas sp.]|uniref:S9 family peptidase n=1 Tax=Propionicimonas sp. TaxID=1955623 RepID=UPI0039E389D0
MTRLPYGSWPSPIEPVDLAVGGVRLSPGLIDAGVRYWTEARPTDAGRVSLWYQADDGEPAEVSAGASVRSAVNEYGGGAWTVRDGLVAYSSGADGSLHLVEDGADRVLAAVGGLRFAALSLDASRRLLLAVREDHRGTDATPEQAIVALSLDGDHPEGGRVLVHGADFYAHPSLIAQGLLAWCEWQLPDMPWDSASIVVAPLERLSDRTVLAGGPGVSGLFPAWDADGGLIHLSDESGYWNLRRWRPGGRSETLWDAPFDFCGPLWVLDPVPYSLIGSGRIGCTWIEDGLGRLGVLSYDPQAPDGAAVGRLEPVAGDAVSIELAGSGPRALAVMGYPDRPGALVEIDWATGAQQPVRVAAVVELPADVVSVAEAFTWDSPDGPVHGWFYPPRNGDLAGLVGELPPVQVWSHGGPTAFSDPAFSLAVQFWTSRGIGILDVNYSGSTGYGRAYRERLDGNWGLADVRDCARGVLALAEAGRADRHRLSIRGGSAGGYTTLAALTFTDVFAAGISLYGIGDLETLAGDTHKFESRYLDGLVAPYPSGREVYLARSPIHHLDRLSCPMLILQGLDDKVVPPNQATAMAEAVRAKGLEAELVLFEGEAHGFRRAETIVEVARAALGFLGRVHGFTPC